MAFRIKNTLSSLLVLISATATSIARGDPICDFDGDGMSELPFVQVNENGHFDWSAFNPRTHQVRAVIGNFGDPSSKLIPGNWFEPNKTVAAIVKPVTGAPNSRSIWTARSLTYAGGSSVTKHLGRTGDLIIQGGDYDGNGITDSLILKRTTGKLGLRVNYFLASYNGNNLGTERLYEALGKPFRDTNFFFSPDGIVDHLAVLRRGPPAHNTVLQLKPFTDTPLAFSIGNLPRDSFGPIPLKQGVGRADLLLFYSKKGEIIQLLVKNLRGKTVYRKGIPGSGFVTVGNYFDDPGHEIALQNKTYFTLINPKTHQMHVVESGLTTQWVSCVSSQTIE
jgi:hypothetical protein